MNSLEKQGSVYLKYNITIYFGTETVRSRYRNIIITNEKGKLPENVFLFANQKVVIRSKANNEQKEGYEIDRKINGKPPGNSGIECLKSKPTCCPFASLIWSPNPSKEKANLIGTVERREWMCV